MYGCHESCDEKTAIQVHPRHFNTELLSSVRLISGCHVVANQTTLATNLPCQRRASGSAANFPRSDVRAHSVSSVNELHPNDIVSRSRHLNVTNHYLQCIYRTLGHVEIIIYISKHQYMRRTWVRTKLKFLVYYCSGGCQELQSIQSHPLLQISIRPHDGAMSRLSGISCNVILFLSQLF